MPSTAPRAFARRQHTKAFSKIQRCPLSAVDLYTSHGFMCICEGVTPSPYVVVGYGYECVWCMFVIVCVCEGGGGDSMR